MTFAEVLQLAAAGICVATTGALALVLKVIFSPELALDSQPAPVRNSR